MQSAGITPEANVESAGSGTSRPKPSVSLPPVGEVNSERLTVFEDFLGKLDLDRLDKGSTPGADKPDDNEEDPGPGPGADKPDKPKRPRKK